MAAVIALLLGVIVLLLVVVVKLNTLIAKETNTVATLADLDAAIAAETQENATLLSAVNKLDTDVEALIAVVKQGGDFTNELNAVQANLATIQGVVASATAEDQNVQGALPQ